LAAKFLRGEGYKVLYRNFIPTKYGRGGQIDLVLAPPPLDNPEISFRFDVVEVLISKEEIEFELIQDAFQLSKPYMY
jgi:Holliday junction resolvase-like predicted endonuclease